MVIFYHSYITIQSIILLMRLKNIINWDWTNVFWIYWVMFSILIALDLGLLIILCGKICQITDEEENNKEESY